jgi:hypothetical protein
MKTSIRDCDLLIFFVSIAPSVTSLSVVQAAYTQEQDSINAESNTTNNSDTGVIVQTYENLSNLFGTPIFLETSHNRIESITINTNPLQTQDSYNATGILKDVGNVIEVATFITTHLDKGKSSGMGKGNFTTSEGEIANYTGQDVGITDSNGIETYKVSRFLVAIPKVSSDF